MKPLFAVLPQLHDAIADFEQEKFDMQKQHTRAIQDILDDTNGRLLKMEEDYSTQVEDHVSKRDFITLLPNFGMTYHII